MKKSLSVMLALCLAFAMPAFAHQQWSMKGAFITTDPDPSLEVKMYITPLDDNKLDIGLANLQKERTTISITSVDGLTTYYRDIITKHNGYRKRLNLNELKDGKYVLVVAQGDEKRQQVIVMKKDRGMVLSGIK